MARTPKITNEQILAAARQIFLEQGPGASTLDIAALAGISEASIFKRFNTKQQLFLSAMGISEAASWVKLLPDLTKPDTVQSSDLKALLLQICQEMLAFYQEVMSRVMMMMARGNLPQPPDFVPPPVRDTEILAQFFERAIAHNLLRPFDAWSVACMVTGSITHYAMSCEIMARHAAVLKTQPSDPNIFIQNLVETLWSGIAPQHE